MRSLLLTLVCLSPACSLVFDGDDGDDVCAQNEATLGAPIAPAPLRDPSDLVCKDLSGPVCDPACGPCPALSAPLGALPSWPLCGHRCESLDEAACTTDPECRVVRDANCTFGAADCFTDFIGCFPIDMLPDASIDCFTTDAWTCSRSADCTAYHSFATCPQGGDCRPFEVCAPEGVSPGQCYLPVTCDEAPPPCPVGTTPGILDGCYTGACIPTSLCAPVH